MMTKRVAPRIGVTQMIILLTAWLGIVASMHAQSASGVILGNITDPSGAAVPATITATNQDTGVVRESATTPDGIYNVPSLLPGNYTIEARAPGFGAVRTKDVVVRVGSETRVDLTLQLGPLAETLTVTEAVPLVGTTDVDVSQVLDALVIRSIPLNARDVQQLAVIQPGVQYLNTSGYGGKSLTVAGSRPIDNRYVQEGMDMTFTYRVSPFNLASGLILGVEAVKEFKVLTTNQSAEYGEASGGVTNVLFKSGTNRFHGSGYEFYRNDVFDARNFFDAAGTPPLSRHQFGASLGGPVRRDKTFFFVNYEGLRESLSRSFVANVPDVNARAGIVPCSGSPTAAQPVGTGVCPPGTAAGTPVTLDPALAENANMIAVRQIFFGGSSPLYPVCNGPSLGGGLCQYLSNPLEKTQQNYVLGKIDHTFNTRNTLSAHYNFDTGWRTTPGELGATADDRINRRQTFTIQDTQILTRFLVNTARLGVNRIWYNDEKFFIGNLSRVDPRLFAVKAKVPCATRCSEPQPGFPSGIVTPPPTISAAGGLTTFGGTTQAFNFAPRWVGYTTGMFSDDLSYLHGKHAIQVGIQLKRWYDNIDQLRGNPLGQWTFTNLPQFLRGAPAQTFSFQNYNKAGGLSFGRNWTQSLIGIYIQDNFKVASNLTLSYGLRWEYVPGPTEKYKRLDNLLPDPETAGAVTTGDYFNASKKDFSPRFGFNWDPSRKGKSSLRAAFSILYNQITDASYFTAGTAQPPFVAPVDLNNLMPFPYSQSVMDQFLSSPQRNPTFGNTIQQNPPTPVKYSYNATFQQELRGGIVAMIGYIGAVQRHNGRQINYQEYYPSYVIKPGEAPPFPLLNPAPQTNPRCTREGQLTCQYWAGSGMTNVNVSGSPAAYATECEAGIATNCLVNNAWGTTINGVVFDANAAYNALQMTLERRSSRGLFARFNYTYARCWEDAADNLAGGEANGGSAAWAPTRDHRANWHRCAYLGNHSANLSLTYDLPFGRAINSRLGKALLNDWQITSLTSIASGVPFDVRSGANTSRTMPSGNGNAHPDWVSGCNAEDAINKHNPTNYIKTSCFALPVPGYLGDVEALPLIAPATWTTDASMKRSIRVREGMGFQIMADVFNIFNRTNFAPPASVNVFTATGAVNTTAGQITRTIGASRQMQFGLRFEF
jgi:hypothetical protein